MELDSIIKRGGCRMYIERVINNNVVSTHDKSGLEIIIMGKGIGYKKKPGQEISENLIEKIFRIDNEDALNRFKTLLLQLPLKHLQVSNDIISYAKEKLDTKLNQNIYITLTDHINFAIERMKENMVFHNALEREVRAFYPDEYAIGEYAIELIKQKTNVHLPKAEAASVAIHIINAEFNTQISNVWRITNMIQRMVEIVLKELGLELNEDNINIDQLVTNFKFIERKHLEQEKYEQHLIPLYDMTREIYPNEYMCCEKVVKAIKEEFNRELLNEEKVYLILAIKNMRQNH